MEELGQKDQISVIFIPSDTAPTSVCVRGQSWVEVPARILWDLLVMGCSWETSWADSGFAAGLWAFHWETLLLCFRELHWFNHWKAAFSLICVPLVGFSAHKHFRDRGRCSPRGLAAHTRLVLVGPNNLKGLFQPKICDSKIVLTTVATRGLSQHPS